MDKINVLRELVIGSSIAETDDLLYTTYVKSTALYDFINDRHDIIQGSKGTGKSALLLYCYENKPDIEELNNIVFVKANEHRGDPNFRRAFNNIKADCVLDIYVEAWKIYIVNLIWQEISSVINYASELDTYLQKKQIITKEPGILSKLIYAVKRATHTFSHPDVNFEYSIQLADAQTEDQYIDFNYIFSSIDSILKENNMKAWVLLDRLDDAFPDWSDSSQKALKSLFYVYKELLGFRYLKLKTFIRTDIFDRITKDPDGFRSLSHIKDKASNPLTWDENKIKEFIVNRFKGIFENEDDDTVLESIFGKQIDTGKRQPNSYGWIINHLTDGNSVFTPRDILDYLAASRQHTLEELESKHVADFPSLFSKTALKKAWHTVSQNKLETQVYAENPEAREFIEKFRGGKAEYTIDKLHALLGDEYKTIRDQLIYIGFLGKYGQNVKIPFLYRPSLRIKQGKA